ncbi:hypothetical protein [Leifsonia sp. NPDC058248]|uniref:hypothetical protein n=1 Tax=Leifsonia sp. NPDC058248 TaxID=3346402 RepID=UPI0036DB8692
MSEDPRSTAEHPGRREARVAAVARACWIAVLVFTGIFHFIRGAPVDTSIFLAGAAVITLDALGWLQVPLIARIDRLTRSRRLLAFVLIAVASAVLALSPLYGGADTAIVVGIGLLVLPVAWAGPQAGAHPDAPPRAAVRRAAIAWSVLVVAGCAWEIAVYFLGRASPVGSAEFPALSDLLDPLIFWPPTRLVLVAVWLLGGYVLIRRGHRS